MVNFEFPFLKWWVRWVPKRCVCLTLGSAQSKLASYYCILAHQQKFALRMLDACLSKRCGCKSDALRCIQPYKWRTHPWWHWWHTFESKTNSFLEIWMQGNKWTKDSNNEKRWKLAKLKKITKICRKFKRNSSCFCNFASSNWKTTSGHTDTNFGKQNICTSLVLRCVKRATGWMHNRNYHQGGSMITVFMLKLKNIA